MARRAVAFQKLPTITRLTQGPGYGEENNSGIGSVN